MTATTALTTACDRAGLPVPDVRVSTRGISVAGDRWNATLLPTDLLGVQRVVAHLPTDSWLATTSLVAEARPGPIDAIRVLETPPDLRSTWTAQRFAVPASGFHYVTVRQSPARVDEHLSVESPLSVESFPPGVVSVGKGWRLDDSGLLRSLYADLGRPDPVDVVFLDGCNGTFTVAVSTSAWIPEVLMAVASNLGEPLSFEEALTSSGAICCLSPSCDHAESK